jgi:hypothetical protein
MLGGQMNRRLLTFLAVGALAAVLALGGAAWALAGGPGFGDDDGPGATGPQADKAKAAALAHIGGGTANAVESEDEEAAWEVEATRPDGRTVDVHLDANFKVIEVEVDSESDAGDDDAE